MARILSTANSSGAGLALRALAPQPSPQASMLPASGCFSAPKVGKASWLLRYPRLHFHLPILDQGQAGQVISLNRELHLTQAQRSQN